jgi:hypothetical protein
MENDSDSDSKPVIEIDPPEKFSEPNPYPGLAMRAPRVVRPFQMPTIEKDPVVSDKIKRLAALGLNKTAVAVASGLTPFALTKFYAEEFASGQSQMQEIVAQGLLDQAKAGNPQILMYLGKTKLGWTETNTVEHIGEIRAVVSAKPLTRDEFEQKYLDKSDRDKNDEL